MIFVDSRLLSLTAKCIESVRIRSFSGPHFPSFGPEKLQIPTPFTQGIPSTNNPSIYRGKGSINYSFQFLLVKLS